MKDSIRKIKTGYATLLLVALIQGCGGSITVESPQADQVYLKSDTVDFSVTFKDIDPLEAQFFLNDENITSEFIVNSESRTATANLPANTILDERSHLRVEANSKNKNVNFYVDRSAPEVVVTQFSPSINLPYVNLTIEGYVTDLSPLSTESILSPQVRYGINFHDRIQYFELDDDNHFSVSIETVPMGNSLPLSLESAPIRFLISDATPFSAGIQTSNDVYAPVTRQPPLAKAHITPNAFENTINPKINQAIAGVNFEALAIAANPALDKDVVLSDIPGIPEVNIPIPGFPDPNLLGLGAGIKVDITSLDIGDVDIEIMPTSAAGKPTLRADAVIQNLDLRIRTALSIELPILPDPTIPIRTRISNADIVGNVLVKLKIDGNQNLQPKLAIDSIETNLSVIGGDFDTLDFSGLPWPLDVALGALSELFVGAIEQFAFELLDNYIANLVGDKLADSIIEKANDELNLIPSQLQTTLRGKEFNFYASEATVQANSNGLSVSITKSDVTARPFASGITKELGWQLNGSGSFRSFGPTTPTGGLNYDVGLSLDWDFLNKTIFEAHRAGIDIISTVIAAESIPAIGNKLGDKEFRINVKPILAPYLDKAIPRKNKAAASVNAKEFSVQLEVRDLSDGEDFRVAAEIRTNIRADVDLDLNGNQLQVLLDEDPEITIRSMVINESEQEIGEAILQDILNYIVPVVMPNLVDAIEAFRLPCIKGHTLDLLELEVNSYGYFNIYANVNSALNACSNTGGLTMPLPQLPIENG